MATRSPYGGFADLSRYQAAAAQPSANPLDSLILGLQQGQALQALPEQIRQQRIAQQIAMQLEQGRLAEQGLRIEALKRSIPTDLQSAIQQATQLAQARNLGVVQAPQIIGQPSALPALPLSDAAQRTVAATPEDSDLADQRISPLEAPVNLGGQSVFDPQMFREAQQQQARQKMAESLGKLRAEEEVKQEFELERIDARAKAQGFKTYVDPQNPTNIVSLDRTQAPPSGYMEVGQFLKQQKDSKSGGVDGLKPTGETNEKFSGGLILLGQINDAIKTTKEIEKSGKFPTAFEAGVNQFLSRRPQDFPGSNLVPGFDSAFAVAQRLARGAQTKESRDIQMKKAMITSTILRTQAGLSQTLGEAINIAPYVPSENDTYESLLEKLELTRKEGIRALKIYKRIYPALNAIITPELDDAEAPKATGSTSGRSFGTEAEARSAGFKNGEIVIIGGQPGVLE